MEEYERAYLESLASNFAVSIASGMRSIGDQTMFEDETTLSTAGRLWVQGYLTGRLSMLRSGSTGNPNLSDSDLEVVATVVEYNEDTIAAQLYA